ncbi:MAG: NADH-quinone oxidoreductase subunit K [Thermoleophilia bacterium]|nr:NADH-quinone oxidoreductase subunit K [Thermoleophilia bacterium]
MTVLTAGVVAVIFGSGAYLLLKPDLFRVVVGIVLVSNAATLALMASGLSRGDPPIAPGAGAEVSDPLVQAMTLTAIVIGFGVAVLLLALVYRIYTSHSTVDLDELSQAEARHEAELEREQVEV